MALRVLTKCVTLLGSDAQKNLDGYAKNQPGLIGERNESMDRTSDCDVGPIHSGGEHGSASGKGRV
jgi:hypothetical protein